MTSKALWILLFVPAAIGLAVGLHGCVSSDDNDVPNKADRQEPGFDHLKAGEWPKGWKVEATHPEGELAEWEVVTEEDAGTKNTILTITEMKDLSRGHFNLCWTDNVKMKDGTLSVRVRANTGKIDQGGGLMWRVADANNYYVARYNPLESNFRLYYVKDGKRVKVANASEITIKAGEWFTMKVVVNGERMQAWLNDKKLLDVTDKTHSSAGGVGLWTKADAATSFDGFECRKK